MILEELFPINSMVIGIKSPSYISELGALLNDNNSNKLFTNLKFTSSLTSVQV